MQVTLISPRYRTTSGALVHEKFADLQLRLESIGEELTDLSVEILREAVEAGRTSRPVMDKKLAQARRAVEKAARLLDPDQLPAEDG